MLALFRKDIFLYLRNVLVNILPFKVDVSLRFKL